MAGSSDSSSDDDSSFNAKELERRRAIRASQGRMQEEGILLGQLTPEEEGLSQDVATGTSPAPPPPLPPARPLPPVRPGDFGLDYNPYPGYNNNNSEYGHWMAAHQTPTHPHTVVHQSPMAAPVTAHAFHYHHQHVPVVTAAAAVAKKPRDRPRKNPLDPTKTKPAKKTTSSTGPEKESMHYSDKEKLLLVQIVLDMAPLGPSNWEAVTNKFNEQVPESRHRKVKNIRNKWTALANTRMPTGNPHMPEYVRIAKRAKEQMKRDAEMITEEDGLEAVIDDGEEEGGVLISATPAPAPPSSISTSTTKKSKTRKRTTAKKEESEALVDFLKVSEKKRAKSQRKREKARAKRKKQEKEKDRQMMLDIVKTATVGVAVAIQAINGGGQADASEAVAKALNSTVGRNKKYDSVDEDSSDSDSASSESTLSSIDSADSPPTQRAKCKQAMRKIRRLRLKEKTTVSRKSILDTGTSSELQRQGSSSDEEDDPVYREQLERQAILNAAALAEETNQPGEEV